MTFLLALSLLACKGGAGDDATTDDTADSAVQNSAPSIEALSLSPELALTADPIVASVTASDIDGDTLTMTYAWFVNGKAAGSDSDTLPAELTAKGQSVMVTVTVDDGSERVSRDSETLSIANTLPVLESVRIGPAEASVQDDLHCSLPTEPSDADGDQLSGSITWTQNGVEVSPLGADQVYPGDTVLASQTAPNDEWTCEVIISDGEASVSQSAQITLPPPYEVLVIWDVQTLGTPYLMQALADAGLNPTLSDTDENSYDGNNPSLADFDAVIHLNGTTYSGYMTESGQQALVDFVNAGGGYLHTEWNAYEVGVEGTMTMDSIQLLTRESGVAQGEHDYSVKTSHPVVAGVPSTFIATGSCAGNLGTVINGGTVLATSTVHGDAVVAAEIGDGRVVGFAHSANYGNSSSTPNPCLADPLLLQMMIDGVYWSVQ